MQITARRAALVTTAAALACPLAAAPIAAAAADAPDPQPVLVWEHAAPERFLAHPKDAAFRDAITGMKSVLLDAPRLAPRRRHAAGVLADALAMPARFAVVYDPQDQTMGAFGAGFVLSLDAPDKAAAERLRDFADAAIADAAPGPGTHIAPDDEGDTSIIQLPIGVLRHGPRRTPDGWRYQATFGAVKDALAPFETLPAPRRDDAEPLMRARLSLAPLTPLVGMARMFAAGSPEAAAVFNQLADRGVIGPEAVSYTALVARDNDGLHAHARAIGAARFRDAHGAAATPIPRDHRRAVPPDATAAVMQRFDPRAIAETVRSTAAINPDLGHAIAALRHHTGVDFFNHVLLNLDGTAAAYMSDTTGGGTIASAVALLTVRDADLARKTLENLLETAAHAIRDGGAIHADVRRWTADGIDLVSLTTPGTPIPVEPTVAFAGHWLVFALNPQGAAAAAEFALREGGPSLLDQPDILAVLPPNREITALAYLNTPRFMASGYPMLTMLSSSLSNTLLAADNLSEQLIVPRYAILRDGAKPMAAATYWDGDDLVTNARADGSVLVNLAGALGPVAQATPIAAAVGSVVMQTRTAKPRPIPPPPPPQPAPEGTPDR